MKFSHAGASVVVLMFSSFLAFFYDVRSLYSWMQLLLWKHTQAPCSSQKQ
jgi:hypothetical protein